MMMNKIKILNANVTSDIIIESYTYVQYNMYAVHRTYYIIPLLQLSACVNSAKQCGTQLKCIKNFKQWISSYTQCNIQKNSSPTISRTSWKRNHFETYLYSIVMSKYVPLTLTYTRKVLVWNLLIITNNSIGNNTIKCSLII